MDIYSDSGYGSISNRDSSINDNYHKYHMTYYLKPGARLEPVGNGVPSSLWDAAVLHNLHRAVYEPGASNELIINAVSRSIEKYGENCINCEDSNGTALLITTIKKSRMNVAKFLIQAGADVNTVDAWHHTPLCYAIKKGSRFMVATLLLHGADINNTVLTGRYNDIPRAAATYFTYSKQYFKHQKAIFDLFALAVQKKFKEICSLSAEFEKEESVYTRFNNPMICRKPGSSNNKSQCG